MQFDHTVPLHARGPQSSSPLPAQTPSSVNPSNACIRSRKVELPLPLGTTERPPINRETLKPEVGVPEKARPSVRVLKIPIRGGAVLEQDQVSSRGLHLLQRDSCSKIQCNSLYTILVSLLNEWLYNEEKCSIFG